MSNVINSVTDDIFQLIVDFWHMLLVNDDDDDDDDVGFSLVFCTTLLCFAFKKYFYFILFLCVCVRVGVCMIN